MKIRRVGAEVFHANRHDEVNSRFSQFCKRDSEPIGLENMHKWLNMCHWNLFRCGVEEYGMRCRKILGEYCAIGHWNPLHRAPLDLWFIYHCRINFIDCLALSYRISGTVIRSHKKVEVEGDTALTFVSEDWWKLRNPIRMASLWAEIRIQDHSCNQNKIVLFDTHTLTYRVTELLKKDSAPYS